ncbi:hypothetical protein Arub01_14250 [Actinomadura rubrobrunea]|uniref:Uncharacterized protein n=1 Tax=Actinomadura rubrobrunea TaxID=115335 RepID=A0A9W6UT16_9ACTN|nr:hypothetical protein Arub01_14250 [Actinomadura rubrobrunea]
MTTAQVRKALPDGRRTSYAPWYGRASPWRDVMSPDSESLACQVWANDSRVVSDSRPRAAVSLG